MRTQGDFVIHMRWIGGVGLNWPGKPDWRPPTPRNEHRLNPTTHHDPNQPPTQLQNRPAGVREGYQTIRACSTNVKLPLGCEVREVGGAFACVGVSAYECCWRCLHTGGMTYIYILTLIPPSIRPSTRVGDGGGRVPDEDEEGRQGREERGREPHGAVLGYVRGMCRQV